MAATSRRTGHDDPAARRVRLRLVANLTEDDAAAVRTAAALSPEQTGLLMQRLIANHKVTLVPAPERKSDNGSDALLPALIELLAKANPDEVARVASAVTTDDDLDSAAWGPHPAAAEALEAVLGDLHDQYGARQALADSGLTCKQAAALLGVREQAITAKIDEGKLIGIKRGREWRLPAWQFVPDNAAGIVPGLDELQKVFPGGPVSLSAWMAAPSVEFDGRTPLQDVLAHGPDRVIAHAARLTASAR
ncbi:helix-turn-helix domain-containing protein [Rhodococcus tukisamuensis]|uniref:DNA binding domain-containing protein, excisionase family n=1 Tax=Rhodococcus tukisamuensis TaxID=168276 RepID=A0A1G7DFZ4_9NOCA|nr:helix-turn-helix domain-containing protein [Rhodococcus tukisamuensis]SDE50437.1 DNA binding domain-containing protein, excisionase family [Rhodococcus tukisamuensis]